MTQFTVEPSQYPEILEKAADILESETIGWCKNSYFRGDESLPPVSACALGAIRLAIVSNVDVAPHEWTLFSLEHAPKWLTDIEFDISEPLRIYMNQNVPLPEHRVPDGDEGWEGVHDLNDLEETTKEQVIEVMKGAAKEWRNSANQ